jgi:MerR family copper efflux transcriptional regulator
MRVGDAARQVGTSARMLRYAEQLGLSTRLGPAAATAATASATWGRPPSPLELQARYGVTPAALAFGLRALEDPEVAGSLHRLARLSGPRPAPVAALDFETAKARRLLRVAF